MGNFPSLVEGAKIFYNGTHENHFLRRKSLKKLTGNCLRNAGFSLFYTKYTVFSSDFTKSRSLGLLLLRKKWPISP